MAIELSAKAKILIEKRILNPNIILEIAGVDTIYGAIDIFELLFSDDGFFSDDSIFTDEPVLDPNARSYISLGSSGSSINQQLLQDKGGTQSISTFKVDLIDKNQEITQLITPGYVLTDILGVRAKIYISYGGTHPEDSILVHSGIISNIESGAATVSLTIDSPERQKHQEIFIKQTTKLNGALNNSDTTITVDSTTGFLTPADSLTTYIQIDDEFIKYTGLTPTTFIGCVRAQLGSLDAAHDDNNDVSSVIRLQDNCIDLALKIMLSQATPISNVDVLEIDNSGNIYFSDLDVQKTYGLVVGDLITTTTAFNPANDFTESVITGFGKSDSKSWITIANTTVTELTSPAVASFKSQYDVLTDGVGMTPQDVDVQQHLDIQTTFSNVIPDYDFVIKDTVKPNDFLNTQIYFPASMYSLPRKTKASVGITNPPLADESVVYLDETNVIKPSGIKLQRSFNKYFYNAAVFKYELDPTDDKYKAGKIRYSADSFDKVGNIGVKPMTVEADGLRDTNDNDVLITTVQRKILDRYQFGAEYYAGIQLLGKTGITIEVGDVVVFGSPGLKLSDTTSGSRNFTPKLYEVVNKQLNVKTQEVRVDLLSTAYALDGRYGIVSPSSYVDTGSTTTDIVIRDSFSTQSPAIEKDKWSSYIGQVIRVHSPDYSFDENTVLVSFDPADDYVMQVSPALSAPPTSGYIIDAPAYDSGTNPAVQAIWKLIHCFFDPQVQITSGTSNVKFDVGAGDVGKFSIGSIVRVHNFDYTVDSPEVLVTDITGTAITVASSLGFVPTSLEYVDLIGFNDGGLPYRLI